MKHQAKIAGQVRHVLTAAGGILVVQGRANEADVQSFLTQWDVMLGAAMAVFGFAWSWFSPAKKIGEGD
jgi:hypothetical protein